MFWTAAAAILLAGPALADVERELGAHEHGHGRLTIAVEGNAVTMELEAPGADIVGFERAPGTDEERAKVDAAFAVLGKPLELFVLPAAAGCSVTASEVEIAGEGGHHEEGGETAATGHEHETEATHNEYRARYVLTCAETARIDAIDFAYFAAFPGAEELEVELASAKGAKSFEVERDEPRLDLAGAM
jgi:hypothetical protein